MSVLHDDGTPALQPWLELCMIVKTRPGIKWAGPMLIREHDTSLRRHAPMDGLTLKRKWRAGQPSAGMWLRLTDPTIVDMIGDLGFDWVMFDAEHIAYDLQPLQALFMALKGTATLPLLRVYDNDPAYIKRVLDIGAAGVLVPQINSAAEAEAAVAAVKYPPV